MSMPKFPEMDSEITCEYALNMILASIAMEELALSHIINAEGEKLQYVLGTLEKSSGINPDIDEILKINRSVTCLLDSVSQNQMILKNKMDKALHALAELCPCRPEPPCPPGTPGPPGPEGRRGPMGPPGPACKCTCRCSAGFKAADKCKLWYSGSGLRWDMENLHGKCVYYDSCDKAKIDLLSKGRFAVSFAVNVNAEDCICNAAVSLQMIKNHQRTDIYTVHSPVPILCDDTNDDVATISMGGIIIENSNNTSSLLLTLESPGKLIVKDAMLSIIEI